MKPGTEADIGPGGEAEWQRLRRQIELAEGFWLGFIFSSSPLSSGVLRRRTERLLHRQTRLLRMFHPEVPADLGSVLPTLFTPELTTAGCTWIEALHLDSGNGTAHPWKEAWLELVSRMNERRDALRRHLNGGLVLIAPPEMKPFMREAASDLWSIRALVVELPLAEERLPSELHPESESFPSLDANGESPKVDAISAFVRAESVRLLAKVSANVTNKVEILLSRVDSLLSSNQTGEAVELARQAREFLLKSSQGGPLLQTMTLHKLAQAEKSHGDATVAEEHLEQALNILGNLNNKYRILLLTELADTSLARGDLNAALTANKESLNLTRQIRDDLGEAPENLRGLSVSLDRMADTQKRLGHLLPAKTAYEESLSLTRQLCESLGATPQALRDLSISLDKMGDIQKRLGNFSAASAAYEESLALIRQLRAILGDTPETLQDLSLSLNHVGNMHQRMDNLTFANDLYTEALGIHRRLRDVLGDTPETMDNLSVALDGLGNVQNSLGNFSTANAAYEESLFLRRQLRAHIGDTPRTIGNLSTALNRLGDIQMRLGKFSLARIACHESISLRRQLRAALGDTPDTLRSLAVSLNRMGNTQLNLGDNHSASICYEETLALARKLRELIGDIPQTLEDLTASLNNVANIRSALGDEDGAARAREEAHALHIKLKG